MTSQGVVIPAYNMMHPTKHNPQPLSIRKPYNGMQPIHWSVTCPTTNYDQLANPPS